jgi:hypothetical protein
MRKTAHTAVATVTVALVASIGHGADSPLRHDPVQCIPGGKYARVAARAVPGTSVAQAALQFRVGPDAPWYSVQMTANDDGWSARLPRPMSLERFEYRIVTTAPDLVVTETPAFVVRVAPECEASDASTAVENPIVVRVPPGAPVAPPVPPGFGPAGVVAYVEPVKEGGKKSKLATTAAIAGGVAAGIAVATAATGGNATEAPGQGGPPVDAPPVFSLFGLQPAANSVLSLSAGGLTWTYRLTGADGVPMTLDWRVELWNNVNHCATMSGEKSIGPTRPENFVLTGPLVSTGTCGTRFDTEFMLIVINVDGQPVHGQYVNRRFHIEP